MGDGNPIEIGLPRCETAVGEIGKRHVETDLIERNTCAGFTVTLGATDSVKALAGRGKLRAVHGERRKKHEQHGAPGNETHESGEHGITPKGVAAVAQFGNLDVWTSQPTP